MVKRVADVEPVISVTTADEVQAFIESNPSLGVALSPWQVEMLRLAYETDEPSWRQETHGEWPE